MKDFELLAKQWEDALLSPEQTLLIVGGTANDDVLNNCKCNGNNCNCGSAANNCDCNKWASTGNDCKCGGRTTEVDPIN